MSNNPDSIYNRQSLIDLLIRHEKRMKQIYEDKNGFSIGIGHYITDENKKSGRIYGIDFRNGLEDKEMDYIFKRDLKAKIDVVRKDLPDFDSYPENLQNQLVSSNFRGSFLQSPKTRDLLRARKYKEAATEFLNNDEYRNNPKIQARMNEVHDAMRAYETGEEVWTDVPDEPVQSELSKEEKAELDRLEIEATEGKI